MRRRNFHLLLLVGMSLLPGTALAQATVSVRGQIFLPTGQPIQEVIRFSLVGDDPRVNEQYQFTDGQGRFILQGLMVLRPYTIKVESDGRRYGTTTVLFYALNRGYVPVSLQPLEKEHKSPPDAVSASRLARPPAKKALKLYEEAVREIQKGKTKLAEGKLRQAIEIDADFVDAYNELAVLQMGKKDYTAAESLLRRALEKDPKALHPLFNLGTSLNYLNRHRDALEPLRQVLEQSPNLLAAHTHLGIALLETDELNDAESHLLRGTKADGLEQALAYLYLGKLYAQKGEAPKAVEAWKTYLQIDPNSPNAERVRALLIQLGHPVDSR